MSCAQLQYVRRNVSQFARRMPSSYRLHAIIDKAEKGIVFIDEIDKIKRGWTGGRHMSGEGVQNAPLTLLDGHRAHARHGRHAARPSTRAARSSASGPGARADAASGSPVFTALCQTQTEDLVAFGMIREFIGRFATITPARARMTSHERRLCRRIAAIAWRSSSPRSAL